MRTLKGGGGAAAVMARSESILGSTMGHSFNATGLDRILETPAPLALDALLPRVVCVTAIISIQAIGIVNWIVFLISSHSSEELRSFPRCATHCHMLTAKYVRMLKDVGNVVYTSDFDACVALE